jgi:hypothetical protein
MMMMMMMMMMITQGGIGEVALLYVVDCALDLTNPGVQ